MTFLEAIVTGLIFGIANAAHCAGMCGVFAVSAQQHGSLTAYFVGKLFTYCFFAALVGALGASVFADSAKGQALLAGAVGLVLCAAGLAMWIPSRSRVRLPALAWLGAGVTAVGRGLEPVFSGIRSGKIPGGNFALGALTGALPCGVVYLALLQAGRTGSAAHAVALMSGFGVGTVPVLAMVALVGPKALARIGPENLRMLGGAAVFASGTFTLWRASQAWTTGVPLCCH